MKSLTTLLLPLTLHILQTSSLKLSSLGSSYAAGPGLPTSSNYAHILAANLSANPTDVAVSGSTLLGLASQIPLITIDSDIVTLTSCGNDLGYIGGLISEGLGVHAPPSNVSAGELLGRFNHALASIRARAPKAVVYVSEYLTVLGPAVVPGSPAVPFNASRVAYFWGVAAELLEVTEKAVKGKGWVELVRVAEGSVGHGVGSSTPWVHGAIAVDGDGIAWHPNKKGMEGVAKMILERIRSRKRGVAFRA